MSGPQHLPEVYEPHESDFPLGAQPPSSHCYLTWAMARDTLPSHALERLAPIVGVELVAAWWNMSLRGDA